MMINECVIKLALHEWMRMIEFIVKLVKWHIEFGEKSN